MDGEIEFNVVMPFVNLKSVGGKFDDESFCAGFEMGILDLRLFQAKAMGCDKLTMNIRADNSPQADLIAMKHGMWIEHKAVDSSGYWMTCVFVQSSQTVEL